MQLTDLPKEPGETHAKSNALTRFWADIVMTLRFFSRLPTGSSLHEVPDLGRIARALPFASIIIGIFPIAVLVLGVSAGLPTAFAATLAVAAMIIVGGGMMEDAIADAADGLFGGYTPERRLEIFKDSRHGTYGVAALCLFLVLRVTALTAMAEQTAIMGAILWLCASTYGRVAGLWMAHALPPARSDGVAATAGVLSARDFWIGIALTTILFCIGCGFYVGPIGTLVAMAGIGLLSFGWTKWCMRLVKGQTGDLLGAAGALGEIVGITLLLLFI